MGGGGGGGRSRQQDGFAFSGTKLKYNATAVDDDYDG